MLRRERFNPGMRFHEKLDVLCTAKRLTNQRELAKLVGVSKSKLNRWLSGVNVPDIEEGARLALILDVPLGFLADDTIDEVPISEIDENTRMILKLVDTVGFEESLRRLTRSLGESNLKGDDAPTGYERTAVHKRDDKSV